MKTAKPVPKVTSKSKDVWYAVRDLPRKAGFALYEGQTVVGIIQRPRNGKRTWLWSVTKDHIEVGYAVGMQAAMDALINAYESRSTGAQS